MTFLPPTSGDSVDAWIKVIADPKKALERKNELMKLQEEVNKSVTVSQEETRKQEALKSDILRLSEDNKKTEDNIKNTLELRQKEMTERENQFYHAEQNARKQFEQLLSSANAKEIEFTSKLKDLDRRENVVKDREDILRKQESEVQSLRAEVETKYKALKNILS